MDSVRVQLCKHRGDYGFDGGITTIVDLVAMGAAGLLLAGRAFVNARSRRVLLAIFELLGGLALLQALVSYLYSTRRGKFAFWAELLGSQPWRGDEHVLEMGCGRGHLRHGGKDRASWTSRGIGSLEIRGPVR